MGREWILIIAVRTIALATIRNKPHGTSLVVDVKSLHSSISDHSALRQRPITANSAQQRRNVPFCYIPYIYSAQMWIPKILSTGGCI